MDYRRYQETIEENPSRTNGNNRLTQKRPRWSSVEESPSPQPPDVNGIIASVREDLDTWNRLFVGTPVYMHNELHCRPGLVTEAYYEGGKVAETWAVSLQQQVAENLRMLRAVLVNGSRVVLQELEDSYEMLSWQNDLAVRISADTERQIRFGGYPLPYNPVQTELRVEPEKEYKLAV